MSDPENKAADSVEPDDIPVGKVILAAAGIGLVVLLLSVLATQLVRIKGRDTVYVKELSVVDPRITETHAKDVEELNSYKVMDAEKGYYRIPISLAMDEMARHPEMIAPIVIPTPEPTAPAEKPAKAAKKKKSGGN